MIIYIMNSWANRDSKSIKLSRGHFNEILASKQKVTEGTD